MTKQSRAGGYKSKVDRMLDVIAAVYQHTVIEGRPGITGHAIAVKLNLSNKSHVRRMCRELVERGVLRSEPEVWNGKLRREIMFTYPLKHYKTALPQVYKFIMAQFHTTVDMFPTVPVKKEWDQ